MKTGIAIFAYTYQETGDGENLNKADLRNRISIKDINPIMTPEFENNLKDMFMDMMLSGTNFPEGNLPNNVEKAQFNNDQDIYEVYVSNSSGIGTDRFSVSEQELKDKFLKNKSA